MPDSRHEVRTEEIGITGSQQQMQVVAARDPDVHPGARTLQPVGGYGRVLERFPAHFEEEPLLRIHALDFARRNSEEIGVEPRNVLEESAIAGDALARRIGIGRKGAIGIPSVRRNGPNRVPSFPKNLPERLGIDPSTRCSTPQPDDRDGLSPGVLQGVQPGPGLLQSEKGAVQWGEGFVAHGLLREPSRSSTRRSMSASDNAATAAASSVGGTVADWGAARVSRSPGSTTSRRCPAMVSAVG